MRICSTLTYVTFDCNLIGFTFVNVFVEKQRYSWEKKSCMNEMIGAEGIMCSGILSKVTLFFDK